MPRATTARRPEEYTMFVVPKAGGRVGYLISKWRDRFRLLIEGLAATEEGEVEQVESVIL